MHGKKIAPIDTPEPCHALFSSLNPSNVLPSGIDCQCFVVYRWPIDVSFTLIHGQSFSVHRSHELAVILGHSAAALVSSPKSVCSSSLSSHVFATYCSSRFSALQTCPAPSSTPIFLLLTFFSSRLENTNMNTYMRMPPFVTSVKRLEIE